MCFLTRRKYVLMLFMHHFAFIVYSTNDGYTKFIDGEVVQTIANRLVIFDGHTKHCGTTHTNAKFRTVINFNYYPCL